jgi:hypothetical protein
MSWPSGNTQRETDAVALLDRGGCGSARHFSEIEIRGPAPAASFWTFLRFFLRCDFGGCRGRPCGRGKFSRPSTIY